jgi:hypothetical protein
MEGTIVDIVREQAVFELHGPHDFLFLLIDIALVLDFYVHFLCSNGGEGFEVKGLLELFVGNFRTAQKFHHVDRAL